MERAHKTSDCSIVLIGSSGHPRLGAGFTQTTVAGAGGVPLGPARPHLSGVVELVKTIRAIKIQTLLFIPSKDVVEKVADLAGIRRKPSNCFEDASPSRQPHQHKYP